MQINTLTVPNDRMTIWEIREVHHLAFAYQQLGRTNEATRLLHTATPAIQAMRDSGTNERPETYESLAINRGLLGNSKGALEALRRAASQSQLDVTP